MILGCGVGIVHWPKSICDSLRWQCRVSRAWVNRCKHLVTQSSLTRRHHTPIVQVNSDQNESHSMSEEPIVLEVFTDYV